MYNSIVDENYEEKMFSIIGSFLQNGKYDNETGTIEYIDMILSYDEYQEYVLVDDNSNIVFIFDGIVKALTTDNLCVIDSIIEIINYENLVKESENV